VLGGDVGDCVLGPAGLFEPLFPFAFQRACHETVLRLATIELASGAFGVDLRALKLELGRAHPLSWSEVACSIARSVASIPAGRSASNTESSTTSSIRRPPTDWQRLVPYSWLPRTHE
jgi:hypothetical protein